MRTGDDNCCTSDDRSANDDRSASDNCCTDDNYHRSTFRTCRNYYNEWICLYADDSQYLSWPISGFQRQRIT